MFLKPTKFKIILTTVLLFVIPFILFILFENTDLFRPWGQLEPQRQFIYFFGSAFLFYPYAICTIPNLIVPGQPVEPPMELFMDWNCFWLKSVLWLVINGILYYLISCIIAKLLKKDKGANSI